MNLRKTTILPTDDANLANRLFTDLVYERPYCLLVVLGTGPDAETFVQRADNLAGEPKEPRWVVWARNPALIAPIVGQLANSQDLSASLNTARGFTISIGDTVSDVISASEGVPGLSRIFLAYAKAEA